MQEYENQETSEAKYVKDLDKFDMILQAHEYEEMENCPGKLQEFFDSTQGASDGRNKPHSCNVTQHQSYFHTL